MIDINIRETMGGYALEMEYPTQSFTIYFNSHKNAVDVKRIIEKDRRCRKTIKPYGYDECYEKVKTARTATPVNTEELDNIRDYYGYDLFIECLTDVIRKYNLD